jgi:putative membrane protein
MSKRVMVIVAMLTVGLFASLGLAQDTTQDTSMKKDSMKHDSMKKDNASMLSSSDKKFVMETAQGGMMEVEIAKLAVDKASSEEVKQYAQRLVDDHTKANDELTQLASQKGVTIPHDEKAMMKGKDKLSKLSGADFDREFMSMMIKDHAKEVKEFEGVSTKAKDTDVKDWAAKTLPTLREHLQMARDINTKVAANK